MSAMETFTREAADIFRIAVRLGGFSAADVTLEVTRLQCGRDAKANAATVCQALQNVCDRYKTPVDHLSRGLVAAAMLSCCPRGN